MISSILTYCSNPFILKNILRSLLLFSLLFSFSFDTVSDYFKGHPELSEFVDLEIEDDFETDAKEAIDDFLTIDHLSFQFQQNLEAGILGISLDSWNSQFNHTPLTPPPDFV